ncbi:MAG: PAS domain S-box protein [Phycisphaerae bacterium]
MQKKRDPDPSFAAAPAWMHALLENAVEAFITIDQRATIVWCNRAAEDMFGWSASEICGRNVSMLMPSPDRERHDGYVRHHLDTGEKKIIGIGREVIGLRKDGSQFPLYLSVCEAVVGNERYFGGMLQDLSERNAARDALRASREFSDRLVETAPIAIVMLNPDESAARVNRYLRHLTGMDRNAEPTENWIEETIVPRDRLRLRNLFRGVMQGEARESVQATLADDADMERIFQWWAASIRDEKGRIIGALLVGSDMTARHHAEAEREQYAEKLGALAEKLANSQELERRRLATELHDRVSQSLALARMQLGSILQESTARTREDVEAVRNVLAEAISATRAITFELGSSLLYEAGLEDALHALAGDLSESSSVRFAFSSDERAKPLSDEKKAILFRAARECMVNVIKHASAGTAQVRLTRIGGELLLEVEDDGQGFEIPKKGFQVSATGGFGLFSIRERLGGFGGTMRVDSTPGSGTIVALRIPVSMDEH